LNLAVLCITHAWEACGTRDIWRKGEAILREAPKTNYHTQWRRIWWWSNTTLGDGEQWQVWVCVPLESLGSIVGSSVGF